MLVATPEATLDEENVEVEVGGPGSSSGIDVEVGPSEELVVDRSGTSAGVEVEAGSGLYTLSGTGLAPGTLVISVVALYVVADSSVNPSHLLHHDAQTPFISAKIKEQVCLFCISRAVLDRFEGGKVVSGVG